MQRKTLIFLCILLAILPICVIAQHPVSISGVITDGKEALPGATIFIAGTTLHTITDATGKYTLINIPNQPFQLVVNYIGFKDAVINVMPEPGESNLLRNIQLAVSVHSLSDVIVNAGYPKKWWETFFNVVVGNNSFSKSCILKNKEALQFQYKSDTLTATAKRPLIFENNALGYRITFNLSSFYYRSPNNYYYIAYVYFEEMPGDKNSKSKWNNNRKIAYQNSMLRFFRILYRSLKETKKEYIISFAEKQANRDKSQVEWQLSRKSSYHRFEGDSLYYKDVLAQPDYFLYQVGKFYNFSKLVQNHGNHIYLQTYYPVGVSLAKASTFNLSDDGVTFTYMKINNKKDTVEIFKNGMVYPRKKLDIEGYWGTQEKISVLLPSDYVEE